MPWTANDAQRHDKAAKTAAQKHKWATVANAVRAFYLAKGRSKDADELAIRTANARTEALARTPLAFDEGRRPEDTFFAGLGDAKRKLAGQPERTARPGRIPPAPMSPAHQRYAANVAQVRAMRGVDRGTRPAADVLKQRADEKAKQRADHAAQQSATAQGANRDAKWRQQNAGWLKRLGASADRQVAQARTQRYAPPGDRTASVPPAPRRKSWDEPTRPSVS